MYWIALPCTELLFPERQTLALDNRIFFPWGQLHLGLFPAGSLFLPICYPIPWQHQQGSSHRQTAVQREEGAGARTSGTPEAGELCWVCPGSLQAFSILLQRCWQPGAAAGAAGEREIPTPRACAPEMSQLHLPGKQNTAKHLRLLAALVTALQGHWGGLWALRSLGTHHHFSVQLEDSHGQITCSTKVVHDVFLTQLPSVSLLLPSLFLLW